MRVVLQRVQSANVSIDGKIIAEIRKGLLLFVGITHDDSETDMKYMAEKCVNLRILEGDAGKMNVSVNDLRAESLVVSQFTLHADTRKGRRPSFIQAAPPHQALPMFNQFVKLLKESGLKVLVGEFGAHMKVSLTNDGPVTIILDSKN